MSHDRIRLGFDAVADTSLASERLGSLPDVVDVIATGHGLDLSVTDSQRALAAVMSAVGEVGTRVLSVEVVEPDLEDVFLHLTGRALRN